MNYLREQEFEFIHLFWNYSYDLFAVRNELNSLSGASSYLTHNRCFISIYMQCYICCEWNVLRLFIMRAETLRNHSHRYLVSYYITVSRLWLCSLLTELQGQKLEVVIFCFSRLSKLIWTVVRGKKQWGVIFKTLNPPFQIPPKTCEKKKWQTDNGKKEQGGD